MTNPARNFGKKLHPRESAMAATAAAELEATPEARSIADVLEHVEKLRSLIYESEKLCQWISSAINTPALPAGAWIYVDVLRMNVLAGMRAAQLLQLKVRELVPEPPAAAKG